MLTFTHNNLRTEVNMYTTGIVRRIDDLGRIVIPKEIRKKLRIRDGENLEILVRDDEIVLKKYSVMKNIEDFASNFTDAIYGFIKHNILITNNISNNTFRNIFNNT